ncbi:MAG TPA: inositol monophosphatase family protein [Fibrobacteria bacterium]|nr:inositol monophosphatase family protein [Fibrobacteria bacterium]
MTAYREETELALRMAGEARKIILSYFQTGLQVETKGDNSPVTIADRKSEEALRALMEKHTPGYGIIGEEFGTQAGKADREWVVDPIDGTKAFIHGVPLFGTLIALLESGKPVVGVIALPALGHVMHASLGAGCHLDGRPCRVSAMERLEDSLLLDGSASTMERLGHGPAWAALRARAKLHRGWGDCYGHFLVAAGRAEAMVDPIVSVWDVAPMAIILPEAGGRFTAFSGNESITENSGISTNGLIHGEILKGMGKR